MPLFRKKNLEPNLKPASVAQIWLRRAGWLLLAIVLVWAGFITWHGVALIQEAKSGLGMAQSGLDKLDPVQALQTLTQAESDLRALQTGLSPLMPVFRLASHLPGKVGRLSSQADPGLDYSVALVSTARQTLQGLMPAWKAVSDQTSGDGPVTSRITAALVEGNAYFYGARSSLAQAAALRQQIDPSQFPKSLSERYALLDDNFETLEAGLDMLIALPELAGVQKERTYLLAAMNDDELRGTGGFISGLGLLRIQDGEITHLTIVDSYILENPVAEYPQPPGALSEFMTLSIWLPRDANWSPDFPQASRDLRALYALTTGQSVDGVIAFDTQAATLLVDALGPLTIEGAPEPVNSTIVQAWMRTAWGPQNEEGMTNEWWMGRKDFMLDLAQAAVQKLQTIEDRQTLVDLIWAVRSALETGHMFLNFNQEMAQGALERAGMDGGVHPGTGDFLMVVDSNIGFNKVNPQVKTAAVYTVDLTDPTAPVAQLEVRYQNKAEFTGECLHYAVYGEVYADMQNRCYWNAWRVLASGGSVLVEGLAQPVSAKNLLNPLGWDGKVRSEQGPGATAQFSGMMVLPGKSETAYQLTWNLPSRVIYPKQQGWAYSLKLQKQGGAAELPVTIRLKSPTGTHLSPVPQGWSELEQGTWQWQGTLNGAQSFQLVFTSAPAP